MFLGFPIDEFRPLPIDISLFHPDARPEPEWDIVFVGKATPHRIAVLDFLRLARLRFLWIAHGCTGPALRVAVQALAHGPRMFMPMGVLNSNHAFTSPRQPARWS